MKLVRIIHFTVLMLLYPRTCTSRQSSALFRLVASGHRLTDHVIKEYKTLDIMECAFLCQALEKPSVCKSMNFKARRSQRSSKNCQLNNATKSTQNRKFRADEEYDYYETLLTKKEQRENAVKQEKSCTSLYKFGERKNGIYTIDPDGLESFQVSCDMKTEGGGWTVFQRRQDESVDFYRGWSDYKAGFGDLNGNFWLGLDKIYRLTKSGQNILRIDLMDFDNTTAYAQYGTFSVAPESENFKLNVGNFSGNGGDSLIPNHDGMKFTTKDKDNDHWSGGNCAQNWKGAWWYNDCHKCNLNGLYLKEGERSYSGLYWKFWKKDNRSMKRVEMKVRPVDN